MGILIGGEPPELSGGAPEQNENDEERNKQSRTPVKGSEVY